MKKGRTVCRFFGKKKMLPLEDYTMKIYGKNNQLVSLERNATNAFEEYGENGKGWSPLIEDSGDELNLYSVKL
ncbi:MAG: hypothetical protein ACK5IQ_05570 [Bacteroidales bacterium]